MPNGGTVTGVTGGFSWYAQMFSIHQEGYPLRDLQVGLVSTWLLSDVDFPSC